MAITEHARERIAERLTKYGHGDIIDQFVQAVEALAKRSTVASEAMRVLDLGRQHGVAWSDEANGDAIWAIVRGGTLITMFPRRSTQSLTAEAFGVERVTYIV